MFGDGNSLRKMTVQERNKVVLGVDPSSTIAAACRLHDKELEKLDTFESHKHTGLHFNLIRFQRFLEEFNEDRSVDIVVIERVAVARSMTTVRLLAYYEAAALLKAAQWGCEFELMEVSRARKKALGKAHSKGETYKLVGKMINLHAFDKGGSDEADAYVAALAGYKL
jgi:Holliday junction resolvasome RuvABC endonuclease subunit